MFADLLISFGSVVKQIKAHPPDYLVFLLLSVLLEVGPLLMIGHLDIRPHPSSAVLVDTDRPVPASGRGRRKVVDSVHSSDRQGKKGAWILLFLAREQVAIVPVPVLAIPRREAAGSKELDRIAGKLEPGTKVVNIEHRDWAVFDSAIGFGLGSDRGPMGSSEQPSSLISGVVGVVRRKGSLIELEDG